MVKRYYLKPPNGNGQFCSFSDRPTQTLFRLVVTTICGPVGLVEFDVVLRLAVQEPVGGID
jgi:hypothetical protein